jgi:hypothetical protein
MESVDLHDLIINLNAQLNDPSALTMSVEKTKLEQVGIDGEYITFTLKFEYFEMPFTLTYKYGSLLNKTTLDQITISQDNTGVVEKTWTISKISEHFEISSGSVPNKALERLFTNLYDIAISHTENLQ